MFQNVTFLGHSAVFLETSAGVIAIDPWLEGNPLCPEARKNPPQLDLIILTHGHADHAGDVVRLSQVTGASIVATWELCSILTKVGVKEEKVIPMNKGGSYSWNGMVVTLTHAMHSSSFDLPDMTVYAGEPVGIVLTLGNTALYHAGDTALFSDMALIRDMYGPSVSFLPIGDRFTMGPKEAARAGKLIGSKTVVPIHYGTFPLLTGTVAEFTEHCSELGLKCVELPVGETRDFIKLV